MQRKGLARLGSGVAVLADEGRHLRAWLTAADAAAWRRPTRCAEWNVQDIVAHLASGELYNQACLRDDIASLGEWADDEAYNVGQVEMRRHLSHLDVFAEWDERHRDVVAAWGAMDPADPLTTSWGPYLVGLQAWHIASEYATHADDIGVPVPAERTAARLDWRFAFSRYAVEECELGITVEPAESGGVLVRDAAATELDLTREQFVAAVSARLPYDSVADDPAARALLRRMKVLVGP
ncbi:maleylpyruvate isomerase N-terminal domain-containing protein [Streptomyces viridosporus]|uniref:maleylpyruvate isomerase N-terminal domain-containing protein n=1 Tax=Streptomyces viridosporus TaxID=67581 RepID=UPI00332956FB